MLSVIIPTLNEEHYLPNLLDSIKRQSFKDYEIIISDAGSVDRTIEIAKSYNCGVVRGGLPAKGRNQGAAVARRELFLFLDAEVLLRGDNFFSRAIEEFHNRKLDVASCFLEPVPPEGVKPPKFAFPGFFYDLLYNYPARYLESVFPYAASLILVKNKIHKAIGGFDEGIKIAEDHHYARKAAKVGKFGILRFAKLQFVARRYQMEGIHKTGLKYLVCQIANILGKDIRSDILNYNFGQYKWKKYTPQKTNPALHILWYLFGFLFAGIGIAVWFMILAIFTPKVIKTSFVERSSQV